VTYAVNRVFIVHHNPNSGRYQYSADPEDAVSSAKALMAAGESTWVAGNCHQMMRVGDLLLFKFGGSRLQQEPGVYAAAHVTRAPAQDEHGTWILRYQSDAPLTRQLIRSPIVGRNLTRVVPRSFGASIQPVQPRGRLVLGSLLRHQGISSGKAPGRERGITRGLLVLKEPLDKILSGTKTWEIRGKRTTRRGAIALIKSKSGHVVGTCEIFDVVGPLSLAELRRNANRTGFRPSQLPYPTTYAWVVRDAHRLAEPIPYRHPPGAVIWVKLETNVVRRLGRLTARPGK
jgi:hypothetical protein